MGPLFRHIEIKDLILLQTVITSVQDDKPIPGATYIDIFNQIYKKNITSNQFIAENT